MSRPNVLKLALAVVGLALFLYGVQQDQPDVRWTGIGFMAAAFLLRLVTSARAARDRDRDE